MIKYGSVGTPCSVYTIYFRPLGGRVKGGEWKSRKKSEKDTQGVI